MKAIQTSYAGRRFRSRTEARWAVFFNALQFRWEYEPEGYALRDGTCRLPDFKLVRSDSTLYCEVKAEEFDDFSPGELNKLRLLADDLHAPVILLTGPPAHRAYQQILPESAANSLSLAFFQDHEPYVRTVDEYWLQTLRRDESTGRMYFDMDERGLRKSFGQGYVDAVKAALAARFEHGETPQ